MDRLTPASRRSMLAWAALTGPPTLWFAHFGLVYAAVSLELTLTPVAGSLSRWTIAAATVAVLAGIGWIAWTAPRTAPDRPEVRSFWIASTRLLALVSAIGTIYDALPALLVP